MGISEVTWARSGLDNILRSRPHIVCKVCMVYMVYMEFNVCCLGWSHRPGRERSRSGESSGGVTWQGAIYVQSVVL